MSTSILYSEISSLYILPVDISSTDILSHTAYNVLFTIPSFSLLHFSCARHVSLSKRLKTYLLVIMTTDL